MTLLLFHAIFKIFLEKLKKNLIYEEKFWIASTLEGSEREKKEQ